MKLKKILATVCTVATLVSTFAFGASAGFTSSFTDVQEGKYYSDAVEWTDGLEICKGYDDNTFRPNNNVSRAQAVTFLNRYNDNAEAHITEQFEDCTNLIQDYKNAIYWAYDWNITTGVTETTFQPNANITRAQAMTFLYRMAGSPVVNEACQFEDIDSDAYYYNAVIWGVASGITNGKTETSFDPSGTCTRGEFVTFLYRYDQYHIAPECQHENEELTNTYETTEQVGEEYVTYRIDEYTCLGCGEVRTDKVEIGREPVCQHKNLVVSDMHIERKEGVGATRTVTFKCEDCGADGGQRVDEITDEDIIMVNDGGEDGLVVYCEFVSGTTNEYDEIIAVGRNGNMMVFKNFHKTSYSVDGDYKVVNFEDDDGHIITVKAYTFIEDATTIDEEAAPTYYRNYFDGNPEGEKGNWTTLAEMHGLEANVPYWDMEYFDDYTNEHDKNIYICGKKCQHENTESTVTYDNMSYNGFNKYAVTVCNDCGKTIYQTTDYYSRSECIWCEIDANNYPVFYCNEFHTKNSDGRYILLGEYGQMIALENFEILWVDENLGSATIALEDDFGRRIHVNADDYDATTPIETEAEFVKYYGVLEDGPDGLFLKNYDNFWDIELSDDYNSYLIVTVDSPNVCICGEKCQHENVECTVEWSACEDEEVVTKTVTTTCTDCGKTIDVSQNHYGADDLTPVWYHPADEYKGTSEYFKFKFDGGIETIYGPNEYGEYFAVSTSGHVIAFAGFECTDLHQDSNNNWSLTIEDDFGNYAIICNVPNYVEGDYETVGIEYYRAYFNGESTEGLDRCNWVSYGEYDLLVVEDGPFSYYGLNFNDANAKFWDESLKSGSKAAYIIGNANDKNIYIIGRE